MTGGVALLKGDQLVGESVLNIRTTHSERLLPALERLLADGGMQVQELDLLSVATGPGSFTGLRIGVTTAKALSYALGVPAVGVTTLEGYGCQFEFFPGVVVALVDARRGNVFWQVFREGVALREPEYGSLQDVLAWCSAELKEDQYLFVGDGSINHGGILPCSMLASQSLLRPSAIAHLGYRRFLAGEHSDAFRLNPTYMRQTEAERKWQGQV